MREGIASRSRLCTFCVDEGIRDGWLWDYARYCKDRRE